MRAARAGVHVLCEKPMAVTEDECREMIDACQEASVKLMIGYRLHFEEANLTAVDLARKGKLGELRYFSSVFSLPVKEGNIRTLPTDAGRGAALRHRHLLHQRRPLPVPGGADRGGRARPPAGSGDERFAETEEQVGATLRFPGERLATFTASFGAADERLVRAGRDQGLAAARPGLRIRHADGRSRRASATRSRSADSASATRSRPSWNISPAACCATRSPSRRAGRGCTTCASSAPSWSRPSTGRKVSIDLPDKRRRPGRQQAIERPPVSRTPRAGQRRARPRTAAESRRDQPTSDCRCDLPAL